METKNCQNCKKDFNIEPEDFSFYDKIKVPPPTFCPECRMQRRMAFMNIYSLYKRACDKCGTMGVSMFHKDKPYVVYCSQCWWADNWDGSEYAMEYDPSRPFLAQVKELNDKTPHMALDTLYSSLINTSFTNYSSHLKNSYALFFADYTEQAYYSEFINGLNDSSDCSRVKESELCYGSIGINKCSRTIFSEECDSCVGVLFSKNCSGCTDCFGCMNLRRKSYCIFNKQYTKDEYFEFLKKINTSSFISTQEQLKKARAFWLTLPVRSYYGNSLNVNVSGDYIYESKNTHDAYLTSGAEDSRYVQMLSVPFTRDAYDYTCWGGNAEKIYESLIAGHGSSNIRFSMGSYPDCLNHEYCLYASSCKNALGCINLKRKEYSILNKQYPKEEYEKLREKIINDMNENPYVDNMGRIYKYGEMLPFDFSPFAYNETIANDYIPLTKEQVAKKGLGWFESEKNQYIPTMKATDLPDVFLGDSSITKEIIECECGRCYRIIDGELDVIKKLSLPLPHTCPECRRKERFSRINPPKLFDRNCAKCNKDIKTSYAPERPEIVYCETCYQQEVV